MGERNGHSGLEEGFLKLLHVDDQSVGWVISCLLELILNLIENYGLSNLVSVYSINGLRTYTAFHDLVLRNDLSHLKNPRQPSLIVCVVTGSKIPHASIRAPKRESTTICLGIAIWPSTGDDPYSCFFRVVEHALNVLSGGLEVVDTFGWGVVRPEEVHTKKLA